MSQPAINPAAPHNLPIFITGPGETDVLLNLMLLILLGSVLAAGVFFFWLHSLPERMVHNKVQFDLVAVLALLSLFTHIHAFWVAALLLALIDLPQIHLPHFFRSIERMAGSLERIADTSSNAARPAPPAPAAEVVSTPTKEA